jgi:hypothetical protein
MPPGFVTAAILLAALPFLVNAQSLVPDIHYGQKEPASRKRSRAVFYLLMGLLASVLIGGVWFLEWSISWGTFATAMSAAAFAWMIAYIVYTVLNKRRIEREFAIIEATRQWQKASRPSSEASIARTTREDSNMRGRYYAMVAKIWWPAIIGTLILVAQIIVNDWSFDWSSLLSGWTGS